MSKPFVVACIPACDEERRIGGVEIVVLGVEPVRILARLGGGFKGRLGKARRGLRKQC